MDTCDASVSPAAEGRLAERVVAAGLVGIGLHTPFTVHMGTAHAVQDKRAETIERFRAANPHRFTRAPRLPKIPQAAYINQPEEEVA